jgi:hypothetical protein
VVGELNKKDYPFKMNVRRSVIVNLVGGLDSNGNWEVGLFEVNIVLLKSQTAMAMYEIYVCQEWARANHLTGTIKLSEYLMGTATDRTLAPTSGTTRRIPVQTHWSGAGSRCSPTQRLPSRTVQPSCPGETRTRLQGWS